MNEFISVGLVFYIGHSVAKLRLIVVSSLLMKPSKGVLCSSNVSLSICYDKCSGYLEEENLNCSMSLHYLGRQIKPGGNLDSDFENLKGVLFISYLSLSFEKKGFFRLFFHRNPVPKCMCYVHKQS